MNLTSFYVVKQQAVKAGTWRKFHIFGTLDDEYVLMDSNDYLRTIQDAKQEFIKDVADGINKDGRSVDAGVFGKSARNIKGWWLTTWGP